VYKLSYLLTYNWRLLARQHNTQSQGLKTQIQDQGQKLRRPKPYFQGEGQGHTFKIEAKANKIWFYAKVKAMAASMVLTRVFDSSWQIDSCIEPV